MLKLELFFDSELHHNEEIIKWWASLSSEIKAELNSMSELQRSQDQISVMIENIIETYCKSPGILKEEQEIVSDYYEYYVNHEIYEPLFIVWLSSAGMGYEIYEYGRYCNMNLDSRGQIVVNRIGFEGECYENL